MEGWGKVLGWGWGGGGEMGLPRTRPAIHVLKQPQSERIVALWAPSAVAGGGARAAWAGRTGRSVIFTRSAWFQERTPSTRERRPWLSHSCRGLGRETSRIGVAHGACGGGPGLMWSEAPFGQVPRRPEPTPLNSVPSRPHPLLGSLTDLTGTLGAI